MVAPQGATIHKLDSASRLKLREQQRASLPSAVVLACGFDNCINLFVPQAWDLYQQQFARANASPLDPDLHDLKRLLIARAEECTIDDQGRIKIPEPLLRWAGLEAGKEAQLIYLDDRYEIWEVGRYNEFLTERGKELKQIARRLLRGDAGGNGGSDGADH